MKADEREVLEVLRELERRGLVEVEEHDGAPRFHPTPKGYEAMLEHERELTDDA